MIKVILYSSRCEPNSYSDCKLQGHYKLMLWWELKKTTRAGMLEELCQQLLSAAGNELA